MVAGRLGQSKRSARLLGAAEGLLREVGAPVYNHYKPDRSLYEHTLDEARTAAREVADHAGVLR